MKILIMTPTFSPSSKETEFFDALSKVPAYIKSEDMSGHLLLELDNELLGRESIVKLATLFDCWGINKSPLETLAQMMVEPAPDK